MSLGKGTVFGSSIKQKLNTNSSTFAKLVGVFDTLPKALWYRYFMESQGYNVEDVCIYQDNQSAILLKKKGLQSVGKGSRHIKIKYFFITDKIKNNELQVMYCPTDKMVADFYTKPLQASLLIQHCNLILGIEEKDILRKRV